MEGAGQSTKHDRRRTPIQPDASPARLALNRVKRRKTELKEMQEVAQDELDLDPRSCAVRQQESRRSAGLITMTALRHQRLAANDSARLPTERCRAKPLRSRSCFGPLATCRAQAMHVQHASTGSHSTTAASYRARASTADYWRANRRTASLTTSRPRGAGRALPAAPLRHVARAAQRRRLELRMNVRQIRRSQARRSCLRHEDTVATSKER